MKWQKMFEDKFENIIANYNLQFIKYSNDMIYLVGKGFILMITIHFDNMYVEYIIRDNNGDMISYNVSSYIVSKFDEMDRKDIVQPQNVEETLVAIITIWSRGLPRHCCNILNGEKDWLEDYKHFELAGKPNAIDTSLKTELEKFV